MNFEISSSFSPTGDQPEAIAALSEGIKSGVLSKLFWVLPVPVRRLRSLT